MARASKRISARFYETVKEPGMHADGDGLYLVVSPTGSKRWAFIFQWNGKRTEMGLGRMGVAEARLVAEDARRKVAQGVNPIEERKASKAQAQAVATFGAEADAYIATHATSFRNAKHVAQWRMTLSVQKDDAGQFLKSGYCLAIQTKRVDQIDTAQVLAVLKPVWQTRPETASRLRGRIERVLDAAKVRGHRNGENPARWRGHLDALLPKPKKLTRGHHAAMPYGDVPALMGKLKESAGMGAAALRFLILTAARVGEVVGARWEEIDLDKAVWMVPADRMKAGREHRVPLTDSAVAILRALHTEGAVGFVFFGNRQGTHISAATVTKALATAGGSDFTVHGFRSSFRDWAGEETSYPERIAEAALAHVIGDATERAYRRGDALAKRRKLMDAWASYCAPRANNVLPMKRQRA
ncbi:tyrosine-type recombinase/integrase [Pelagibacterium luteolum]|uniref:Integrase n=1 Tax=Pelagibacterium luteolum TaxID=440168 RepID=A0A1G7S6Q1_9HYPH|nr:site-specific integrase [Pelagibacterium luteolum]SDG18705.1 Integrase [Pelagibacterium luteolum]